MQAAKNKRKLSLIMESFHRQLTPFCCISVFKLFYSMDQLHCSNAYQYIMPRCNLGIENRTLTRNNFMKTKFNGELNVKIFIVWAPVTWQINDILLFLHEKYVQYQKSKLDAGKK